MNAIFISYRRDDSQSESGRLHDALAREFGADGVFQDVETLRVGDQWKSRLREAVEGSAAIVTVIGPDWLRAQDQESGMRRLDQDEDWVRNEIEYALAASIPIFPVLVRDAAPPPVQFLPQSIRPLANCQPLPIRADSWRNDVEVLCNRLQELPSLTRQTATKEPRADFHDYLQAVSDEHSRISIRGISSSQRTASGSQAVEDIYTQVQIQDASATSRAEVAGRVPLRRVIHSHPMLFVEGPAGAGKTTFLKLAACMLARDHLEHSQNWTKKYLGWPAERQVAEDRAKPADDESPGAKSEPTADQNRGAEHTELPIPVFLRLGALVAYINENKTKRRTANYRLWIVEYLEAMCADSGFSIDKSNWSLLLERGAAWILLDGLDEIADMDLRGLAFDIVRDAVQKWKGCRFTVTSRPIGARELDKLGFYRVQIEPFSDSDIREFLDNWFQALVGEGTASDASERDALERTIFGRPDVRRLAGNPVMLTSLCVVHWNEGQLPNGRSRVYRSVINWLLRARSEVRHEYRSDYPYTDAFAERAFAKLACAMSTNAQGKLSVVDLEEAAEYIDPVVERDFPGLVAPSERRRFAREWLLFECLGSGIIEELHGNQIRFWHLTFQEFLTAQQLAWMGDDDAETVENWWPTVALHLDDSQWREILSMLPACLHDKGQRSVDLLLQRAVEHTGWSSDASLPVHCQVAGMLTSMVDTLSVLDYQLEAQLLRTHQTALHKSEQLFTREGAAEVATRKRLQAIEALGKAGDPRLLDSSREFLPIDDSRLALAKFPVTVEEYRRFMDDGAYEKRELWGDSWQIRNRQQWFSPAAWADQLEFPNRPVVGVSWFEALAFGRWLSLRQPSTCFRLPTSSEWEMACHLGEQSQFPWGESPPSARLANYAGSIGSPSPVGLFPNGASPGGHQDMAGNVWEWCESVQPSAEQQPGAPAVKATMLKPIKGGSWAHHASWLKKQNTGQTMADQRDNTIGFRILSEIR